MASISQGESCVPPQGGMGPQELDGLRWITRPRPARPEWSAVLGAFTVSWGQLRLRNGTNPTLCRVRTKSIMRLFNVLYDRRADDCEHRMESAYIGAGLERDVCLHCGEIRLRYLNTGLAWEQSA